jgi:hypothetical protein
MDIILMIVASFWVSKTAKEKGLAPNPWVWRLLATCISFELIGGIISLLITGGNIFMAAAFGFFCAIGGFLLVKNKLDKIDPEKKKEHHWMDNIIDRDGNL